jgi:ubiquinone/menaquinone biosynthesis C-methylase UbiE
MISDHTLAVPNHHADYPGFKGASGALFALGMAFGRRGDAALAMELAALHPSDQLVDVGCGPGAAARRAARIGAGVTGIDPAGVMLDVARTLTRRRSVVYLDGRAEALPLPDGAATVVWSIASVHHWADVGAGIAEAGRVLQDGGRLVAIERRTGPNATGLASHGWTDGQADAFAACCTESGFVDVRVARRRVSRRRSLVAVVATKPST